MFTYDSDKILDVVLALDIPPTAKETAMPLIEAWAEQFGEYDSGHKTLAVECPFYIVLENRPDAKTVVVGVIDRVAQADDVVFGCEWKTTKEPSKNKDGSDSKWWNEDKWMESMLDGAQIPIYALGLKIGVLLQNSERWNEQPSVSAPVPIMVRAAIKSSDPRWWPENHDPIFEISKARLNATKNALINKANAIRGMRRTDILPWALTGNHCTQFNRKCEFYKNCLKSNSPTGIPTSLMNPHNPGSAALKHALAAVGHFDMDKALLDSSLVVLSYSSYTLASQCMEKFRIITGSLGSEEESIALQTGTAFHSGIAELYRQMMEA